MTEFFFWCDEENSFHEPGYFKSKHETKKALQKYLKSKHGKYVVKFGIMEIVQK